MSSVVSVNLSKAKGEIKTPVPSVELRPDHGIVGDAHSGNWHRQISLLAQESIDKMRALGLPDIDNGNFAENITTQGLVLHTLPLGTKLRIGNTLHEVTQIGKHCHQHCDIYRKIGQCIMPTEGIFTKVLVGGTLQAGDEIVVEND